jgi:hypothetical protein
MPNKIMKPMFLACCTVGKVHVIRIDCAGWWGRGLGWGFAVMVVLIKELHHDGEET